MSDEKKNVEVVTRVTDNNNIEKKVNQLRAKTEVVKRKCGKKHLLKANKRGIRLKCVCKHFVCSLHRNWRIRLKRTKCVCRFFFQNSEMYRNASSEQKKSGHPIVKKRIFHFAIKFCSFFSFKYANVMWQFTSRVYWSREFTFGTFFLCVCSICFIYRSHISILPFLFDLILFIL